MRRVRFVLWLSSAVFAAGAALAVGSAWLWPVREPAVAAPRSAAAGAERARQPELPPLSAFEPVLRLKLRGLLVDPPAPAEVARPAAAPGAAAPVKLVGTAIERGHSVGIFMTVAGEIEVRGVGEKAGGAEVVRVDTESAVLRHNGRTIDLKMIQNLAEEQGAATAARARRDRRAAASAAEAEEMGLAAALARPDKAEEVEAVGETKGVPQE